MNGAKMKRFAPPVLALTLTIGIVVVVSAQQNNIPPPNANCTPLGDQHLNGQRYPTTIEPEFSVWCYTQPAAIPATRISGANDWVDTFDNSAPSILKFNDHDMGYRVFDVFNGPDNSFKAGYFVNVDHWMIDLADISPYRLSGGVLVSPDRQFFFENGKLVIEADLAGGSDGMGGANRFYEIDVSPAREPTFGVDNLYGYGSFGGIGGLGCRIERNDDGGNFVCAMYDNSGRATDGSCVSAQFCVLGSDGPSGRKWETQGIGTPRTAQSVVGGYSTYRIPGTSMLLRDVWRICQINELDLHCRDRFRMELTKDSIHMFVNGFPAMQIDGLFAQNPAEGWDNRVPDSWFQQGVRPYFTSWINGGQHTPTRWHWDRIAVNPHAGGSFAAPSAAPSFCLGQPDNTCPDPTIPGGGSSGGPAPATATPIPNATATRTPTVTQTPRATATRTPVASTNTPVPPTSTPVPTTAPGSGVGSGAQMVTFDDLTRPNRPISGQYPNGLIDWGTNAWYLSGPFGAFNSNSVSFNGAGPTSQSLRFLVARRLASLDAYNGGNSASTVTLSCAGQTTKQQSVAARQRVSIQTGWSAVCSSVTVGSSNGWSTNFDNFSIDTPLPPVVVNFNDQSRPNRVLNGQYPTGVIDWGTNGWWLSGPYGAFTTNSVSFNGKNGTSQGFGLPTPRRLVQVDAYNGGTVTSTVTLSCNGQPTRTFSVAVRTTATLATGWTSPCNTITITSSNGWNTNFDNFTLQ